MFASKGAPKTVLCVFCIAATLGADLLPEGLDGDPRAKSVLDQTYIHVHGAGSVEVAFANALRLVGRPDLLTDIQAAYSSLLDEGERPEFEIKQTEPGHYSFENRHKQTTRIVELFRGANEDGGMDVVLYSEGTRSFGDFQSLTHIRVKACDQTEGNTAWEVNVYAYPVNRFSRFFARNFGIAQRFFRSKTREISDLAVEISEYFVESEPGPSP